MRHPFLKGIGVLFLVLAPPIADAQEPCPPGVNEFAIRTGRQVYFGGPSCVSCHGPSGKGGEHGPDLTDDVWLHGTGTFEEIVELVTHGVKRSEAVTGKEMPQRGWAGSASEFDIKAVAAFVWSLSHPRCKPASPLEF